MSGMEKGEGSGKGVRVNFAQQCLSADMISAKFTLTPFPLFRWQAAALCYPSADGTPRHPVPLERTLARPRADGDVPALPVAPLPRRPAVRIGRRAVVHDGVRAGAAVDGGVRGAVGVPGVQRLERPA